MDSEYNIADSLNSILNLHNKKILNNESLIESNKQDSKKFYINLADYDLNKNKKNELNSEFIEQLPKINYTDNQFLIEIFSIDNNFNCFICIRQLYWSIYNNIKNDCIKLDETNRPYLSEEALRRKILNEAIVWLADLDENIIYNDPNLIDHLNPDVIEELWPVYIANTSLSEQEKRSLYDACLSYFSDNYDDQDAIPTIIIEFDYLTKWGGMSRSDLNRFTHKEMQQLKIIQQVYSQVNKSSMTTEPLVYDHSDEALYPDYMYPPGVNFR